MIHMVETSMDTSTTFLRQIQSMEAGLEASARIMENVSKLNATLPPQTSFRLNHEIAFETISLSVLDGGVISIVRV